MVQATSRRGEIPRRPERAQIHQEAEECAAQEGAAETALHQVPPQLPPAQAGQSRRPPVLWIRGSFEPDPAIKIKFMIEIRGKFV